MGEPICKEFCFKVYGDSTLSVEAINLISQVMDYSYRDLTEKDRAAIAEWFYRTYKND